MKNKRNENQLDKNEEGEKEFKKKIGVKRNNKKEITQQERRKTGVKLKR